MSENGGNDVFERMVERVLSYRPKKKAKAAKKKRKAKRTKLKKL